MITEQQQDLRPMRKSSQNTTVYEFDILAHRVRELAYLNRGLSLQLQMNEKDKKHPVKYYYEGGIKSICRGFKSNQKSRLRKKQFL